jgi:hypothetical protein
VVGAVDGAEEEEGNSGGTHGTAESDSVDGFVVLRRSNDAAAAADVAEPKMASAAVPAAALAAAAADISHSEARERIRIKKEASKRKREEEKELAAATAAVLAAADKSEASSVEADGSAAAEAASRTNSKETQQQEQQEQQKQELDAGAGSSTSAAEAAPAAPAPESSGETGGAPDATVISIREARERIRIKKEDKKEEASRERNRLAEAAAEVAAVAANTEGAVQIEQGELKAPQYCIPPPPPAKTAEELEAGRKKPLEEDVDLGMFGGSDEAFVCEGSDEEEPEKNSHLKKDPYDSAAARVAASGGASGAGAETINY